MSTITTTNHILTRSPNGYLAGVCEGLGEHLGIEPHLLRLGWIIAVLFFGTGILIYGLLWWLMPQADNVPVEPGAWRRRSNGRHAPPWRRTTVDRKLFGVCGGIARRLQVDPTLVRLGALGLFVVSAGAAILIYLVAAVIMPSGDAPLSGSATPVEL